MLQIVITTIQRPTPSVVKLAKKIVQTNTGLVIAGDSKGPPSYDLSSVEGHESKQLSFISLRAQLESGFELARRLPTKHYSRKNIAYLHAIAQGADCIYETDDDNAPMASWDLRQEYTEPRRISTAARQAGPAWVNVYRHFSQANIWPRGLPLDQIHTPVITGEMACNQWAPIQQGLANGSPDVDAIWRLVMDSEFTFDDNASVMVELGQWCPFNTQSTWWWPKVYPLLYIPSNCSFRMCDIWKSFVAQRCLWELGTGVVFHAPEVYQERNPHNLMRDFSDEVIGYEQNHRIAEILLSTTLEPGKDVVEQNLLSCYQALVEEKIFPEKEIFLLELWLADLKKINNKISE